MQGGAWEGELEEIFRVRNRDDYYCAFLIPAKNMQGGAWEGELEEIFRVRKRDDFNSAFPSWSLGRRTIG